MKLQENIQSHIAAALTVLPVSFLKISPIWGSYLTFFTPTQIIIPGAGLLLSPAILMRSWALKTLWYACTHAASPLFTLCYHVPTTCAALYMAAPITIQTRISTVLAFVFAGGVFFAAVGATPALLYMSLWIVPAFLAARGADTSIARAYIATFIAHAVGSAIWAWAFPLAPAAWVALIPIAIAERFCYAAGIAAFGMAIRSSLRIHIHSPVAA